MQTRIKNYIKRIHNKSTRTGLAVIILAAILLESISAIQYYYTRGMLERNLEKQVLILLRVAAQRMDGIMHEMSIAVCNQVWHAQQHLDNPSYMETLVSNLTNDESDKIAGAAVAFCPNYYSSKGYWYEPYARQEGDTIIVRQIGSEKHDYFTSEFYKTCIKGDTLKWNTPYMDFEGAQGIVSTFALPIRDSKGKPVAALGIDITTDWLSDMLRPLNLHPSSFTMIMSQEGQLIAVPNETICSPKLADQIASMVCDSKVKKKPKANGQVTSFKFYDKEQGRHGRVYFARKLYAPKWLLVKVCYDDEAFGQLNKLQRNILWMTLAGLLVFGLIIQLFARNIRKLQMSIMKQQRIDGELQIANAIQMQMLPHKSQDDPRVDVYGSLTPAREVGGDLYAYFIRDEKLFFCIGDVSGKGIPASIIMAVSQSLFYNTALHESNPAFIMERMNISACNNNESNMFATLFIGVLDLPTGRLRLCNAGHEVPILIEKKMHIENSVTDDSAKHLVQSPTFDIKYLDVKPNLPIGLFRDFKYTMQEMVLTPGSSLFLYTDGLTEARNSQNQLFGRKSVGHLLDHCCGMSSKETVEKIIAEVDIFSEHTQQSDDLTLMAISYTPAEQQLILDEQLTLSNNVKEVVRLSRFIKDVTARLKIGRPLAPKLQLALEEAVVNVMEYAYPAGRQGDVNIRATFDGHLLRLIISDSGIPFDPTEATAVDTTLSAEERPVGGLGIMLIRELMDIINYEREGGKNILTLTKKIEGIQ